MSTSRIQDSASAQVKFNTSKVPTTCSTFKLSSWRLHTVQHSAQCQRARCQHTVHTRSLKKKGLQSSHPPQAGAPGTSSAPSWKKTQKKKKRHQHRAAAEKGGGATAATTTTTCHVSVYAHRSKKQCFFSMSFSNLKFKLTRRRRPLPCLATPAPQAII